MAGAQCRHFAPPGAGSRNCRASTTPRGGLVPWGSFSISVARPHVLRTTRLLLPLSCCSPSGPVVPRASSRAPSVPVSGEARVSLGGPFLTNLGPTIPLPNVSVGGRYGVADGWDVDGNFSVLGAAFGTVYVDPAVVAQLYAQEQGPALSASLRANLFLGSSDGFAARIYPEVGLHGELPLGIAGHGVRRRPGLGVLHPAGRQAPGAGHALPRRELALRRAARRGSGAVVAARMGLPLAGLDLGDRLGSGGRGRPLGGARLHRSLREVPSEARVPSPAARPPARARGLRQPGQLPLQPGAGRGALRLRGGGLRQRAHRAPRQPRPRQPPQRGLRHQRRGRLHPLGLRAAGRCAGHHPLQPRQRRPPPRATGSASSSSGRRASTSSSTTIPATAAPAGAPASRASSPPARSRWTRSSPSQAWTPRGCSSSASRWAERPSFHLAARGARGEGPKVRGLLTEAVFCSVEALVQDGAFLDLPAGLRGQRPLRQLRAHGGVGRTAGAAAPRRRRRLRGAPAQRAARGARRATNVTLELVPGAKHSTIPVLLGEAYIAGIQRLRGGRALSGGREA